MRELIRYFPVAPFFFGVAILSGCSGALFQRSQVEQVEGPPAYKQGFLDGCSTAYSENEDIDVKGAKDAASYAGNKHYRLGWDDGRVYCHRFSDSDVRANRTQ